jgi:hypothetical protein
VAGGHGAPRRRRALIRQARAALHAKYGWQLVLLDLGARLTGRLQRRAYIEIEL